jgi:hypothetical protein
VTAAVPSNPPFQKATRVLGLINSRPTTPSKTEIAAIIAKWTLPTPDVSVPKLRAEYDRAERFLNELVRS